jgi:predicted nuclease of predicted toxin-antitoxin system
MQLVADENVPGPVIDRLRADGHVIHAISEMSAGLHDTGVLATSHAMALVLITHDRDFGELAVRQGLPVSGVILLEVERLSLGSQIERISQCLSVPETEWVGYFTVLDPSRLRRRAL